MVFSPASEHLLFKTCTLVQVRTPFCPTHICIYIYIYICIYTCIIYITYIYIYIYIPNLPGVARERLRGGLGHRERLHLGRAVLMCVYIYIYICLFIRISISLIIILMTMITVIIVIPLIIVRDFFQEVPCSRNLIYYTSVPILFDIWKSLPIEANPL